MRGGTDGRGGAGRGDARRGLYFFTGSEGESSGCGEQ